MARIVSAEHAEALNDGDEDALAQELQVLADRRENGAMQRGLSVGRREVGDFGRARRQYHGRWEQAQAERRDGSCGVWSSP